MLKHCKTSYSFFQYTFVLHRPICCHWTYLFLYFDNCFAFTLCRSVFFNAFYLFIKSFSSISISHIYNLHTAFHSWCTVGVFTNQDEECLQIRGDECFTNQGEVCFTKQEEEFSTNQGGGVFYKSEGDDCLQVRGEGVFYKSGDDCLQIRGRSVLEIRGRGIYKLGGGVFTN